VVQQQVFCPPLIGLFNFNFTGGEGYDNPYNPTVLGSGGGNTESLQGGAGGGLIHIVGRNISLSGYLLANGLAGTNAPSSTHSGAGGGSGGSININALNITVSPTAYIAANGGNGGLASLAGGGGAGGSVFVNATNTAVTNGITVAATGGITPCIGGTHNGTLIRKCAPGNLEKRIPITYIAQASVLQIYFLVKCARLDIIQTDILVFLVFQVFNLDLNIFPHWTYLILEGSSTHFSASVECAQCIPGFYSDTYGAAYCIACADNTYTNSSGQTTCTPCSPGRK
jgi:hypothetical protein